MSFMEGNQLFATPISDNMIEEITNNVRRQFSMKPQIAIAGFGKAGKSSLFNSIYGENVAKVSMRTDETTEMQSREKFGIDFTDTPGIGTAKFSFEKVKQMGVFDRQHIVIHVLNGASAISEQDEHLHELITQSSTKRVTVVNKVDILDLSEQEEYAQRKYERETRALSR
ncbi:GTP-binding protein engA [Candidatus Moduliflexus flocculans]|uniref:GTP-binding protein engA n=1 Tax=Candidatus Moduliflexus flocculans TaxID=1499966 RepID=A0A0S6VSA6_9BACT|nr:GTP-binding protein engA [Candidatus Moduliflexus flocculans]